MNNQNDYSVVANRFRLVAQRFCTLVDSACTLETPEFLLQIYRSLPELIDEAMRLPRIESGEDEDNEQDTGVCEVHGKPRMKHEEWKRLYNTLNQKLGQQNLYWQVFDPTKDNEAIRGSLADDLTGICCDLKKGIDLNESDKVLPQDIIFEWRFGFYIHWGKHAIDALRTIHFLLNETLA